MTDRLIPSRLQALASPPKLLRLLGSDSALASKATAAIVGTRESSRLGEEWARTIAACLADHKVSVVSGLARGIDTASHSEVVARGGLAIACLGSGLKQIYPGENRELAEKIIALGGALISERGDDENVLPQALVARNRLITGLSDAVFVVESCTKSGTMHAVRFAARQGRPIICPVTDAGEPLSKGTRILLERPARELPELIPQMKPERKLLEELGQKPLAEPVSTSTLLPLIDSISSGR